MAFFVPVDIAPPIVGRRQSRSGVSFYQLKQEPRSGTITDSGPRTLTVLFGRAVFLLAALRFRNFAVGSLLLARSLGPFARAGLRFFLARVVDQFNDREFSAIARSPAHFYDSGITARALLKALTQFIEQTAQRGDTSRARRRNLAASRGGGPTMIARVKERSGLPAQMNARSFRSIAFETRSAARKRDGFLNKRPQLLRLGQGRDNSIVTRINQRGCEVSQQRDTVFCWSPEFSMGFKMTHVPLSYCTASSNSSSSPPRSSIEPSPEPGIGLPCSSNCMPKSSPIPRRMSRISVNDFLPKFFVASISRSERWTRSRIVLIPAFFRQL